MPGRILIIEDNATNQELMRYLLEAYGHSVMIAVDGETGWETARRERPDLVLCDIQLPKLDGYELIRRFKADPDLRSTPVIAVTALAMVGDRETMLNTGFDGYISKPLKPESFVQEVEALLPRTHKKCILIVDDRATNRQLLLSLLSYGGHDLLQAVDGADALEQARAKRPDLIITDILMPRMDGFEFVQALRKDPAIRDTAVIFYTATYRQNEADALAKACGVAVVIPKPSEPQVILDHVNRLLNLPPQTGFPPAGVVSTPPASAFDGDFSDHLSVLRQLNQHLLRATQSGEALTAERDKLQILSGKLVRSLQSLELIGFRLSALLDLSLEVARQRDPVRLLEIFCGAARNILNVHLTAIGIVGTDGRTVEHLVERKSAQANGSFSHAAMRAEIERALSSQQAYRDETRLLVPLVSHLEPLGWLYAGERQGGAPFTADDEEILQTIAAQLSVAYDNLRLYDMVQRHAARLELEVAERKKAQEDLAASNQQLEARVAQRTNELQSANAELESFSYSVSHDLRAPLRSMASFSQMLSEDYGAKLGPEAGQFVERIRQSSQRMGELIDGLLAVSGAGSKEIALAPIDLTAMAQEVVVELRRAHSDRALQATIDPKLSTIADPRLMRLVLENLIGNAWKFTANTAEPRIHVGQETTAKGPAFFVRDNGAGFAMEYAHKLFVPFQRLHRQEDYRGTGIGLATVRRILKRHGGEIWVEAKPNEGATFYFTLGQT